jgi:hypothetical protein
MVGVRSSKGCKRCRGKKRRCDLSQPICGQCLKLGANCTYEDRSWVFIAQQQQEATINQQPPVGRSSLSPSSLLLADQRQQLEAVSFKDHWPSGTTSIGDGLTLSSNIHVGQNEDATHDVAEHRTSSLREHVYTDRPCDLALVQRKKCVLTAKDVAQDIGVIAHIEASICCFRSPVAERVVGMTVWVEAFMPPSAWDSSIPASALGAWALPRCKSHEYGNDAIALLNLGCSKGDDRIKLAGRRLHLATIQSLRIDVACSSLEIQGTFAALIDLMLASCYTVVSPGVTTWLNHLMGQTRLLKTRLTECKTIGFGTFVFMHYRQLNLIHSLIYRKRMPLAMSDWKIGDATLSSGSSEAMYRLALRVPTLLEITDQLLLSMEDCTREATRVRVALLQLESSLLEWFEAWIALQPTRKPLASALTNIETILEPCATICFEDGLVTALVWSLLLLLHESIYNLTKSLPSDIHSITERVTLDKANTYARLLCQSVHHLCQQAGAPLSKALAVSAPLHFVTRWYSCICDTEQVERCITLERDLRESVPYLDWGITIFWSFISVNWLLDEGAHINRSFK